MDKDFLGGLLRQFQQFQEQAESLKAESLKEEVTGNAGAGLVEVSLNGAFQARRVKLDPSLKEEDLAVVEELVAAAFNDAVRRLSQLQKEQSKKLMEGFSLPPGFKLPF